MSQLFQRAEGIILRVIPFGDYDQILTIFTRDAGMLKVLFKGSRSKRRGVQGICIPLTAVEIVYREKKGEIFSCIEMTLIDSHHALRGKLVYLEAACDLLRIIADTQLIGRASPQLYTLLELYLRKIPHTSDPWMLAVSFRLKLLFHEGMLVFPFGCCACGRMLQFGGYSCEGDWWCTAHEVSGGVFWSSEELELMYRLGTCSNYREIAPLRVSSQLYEKMANFFETNMMK